VRENIPSFTAPLGALVFRRRARIVQASAGTSQIRVDGNLTAAPGGLAIGNAVRIFGSAQNGGNYTATNVTFAAGQTVITVAPALTSSVTAGYIDYEKRLSITSVDQANRRFTVAGDHTAELRPPRIETIVGADGAIITRVTGGMTGNATITEIPDGASPRSGAFEIVFDSLTLPDHVDPSIEWYRGTVRVLENAALFAPGSRPAERKILNVWRIDRSGTTLKLIAFDPSFDPSFNPANAPFNPDAQYVPIATGANVDVNVHPGYRLYLTSEAGFTESVILPATGEGNRKTLLAARSADTAIANTFSPLTPPAILLAQELRDPVPPGVPVPQSGTAPPPVVPPEPVPPPGGGAVPPVVPAEPALAVPVCPPLADCSLAAPLPDSALWLAGTFFLFFSGGSGNVLVLIGVRRSQLAPPRRRSPVISSTPSRASGVRSVAR